MNFHKFKVNSYAAVPWLPLHDYGNDNEFPQNMRGSSWHFIRTWPSSVCRYNASNVYYISIIWMKDEPAEVYEDVYTLYRCMHSCAAHMKFWMIVLTSVCASVVAVSHFLCWFLQVAQGQDLCVHTHHTVWQWCTCGGHDIWLGNCKVLWWLAP